MELLVLRGEKGEKPYCTISIGEEGRELESWYRRKETYRMGNLRSTEWKWGQIFSDCKPEKERVIGEWGPAAFAPDCFSVKITNGGG